MAIVERVALITGGSRGLGYTLAEFLARQRWTLILTARDESALREAADRLRETGATMTVVPGDVSEAAPRPEPANLATRRGRLDHLANNASNLGPSPPPTL